ncbi:MAG: hypothetical protein IKX31_01775 [Muribaculaceae bacterium]|nr:hypothetical protein [Muribaculaceae bacterium]
MNKLKLLFIVAALFVTFNVAHAGGSSMPWCDCHVLVKSTGGGKVYVTPNSGSQTTANCTKTEYLGAIYGKTHDTKNAPAKIYLAAKPDTGWEFDYWECTKKYGDYDNANGATAVNTKLYDALPSYQKAALSIMYPKNNDGGSNTAVTASNDTNAIWVAHFKRAEMQTVTVQTENSSLGTANIDKVTNYVGDEVTLSAWCGNSGNNPRSETIMFLGWYRLNETTGEKEFVSDEYIYTFTITEQNKGAYYARYASGYNFWRVKNVKYANYLTSVAHYDGPITTTAVQSALQTQLSFDDDLATALTDEGSMMKLWISGYAPNTHREILDIYVQDEHTNQYYGEEAIAEGVFLQMSHQLDNTYYIQGNNGSFTITESSDKKVNISTSAPKSANWRFEGMDKDLTTKRNYFAVNPSEFIGPDNEGNYWTTLRVCFNMKYETSEITPYIVTAADANTGNLELTEVTGGIIPEKTCVLLKCKSTDVTRNVMIPTTSTSSFSTSGNLLTSSTYYYKNQSVSSSENLKGIKLIDGRLGFGGNTLTSVNGNRAYLSIVNDVAVPAPVIETTLAALIASGDTQNTYCITDLTAIETVNNDRLLICKDNNRYATKDEKGDDEYIDFMHTSAMTNGIESTIPDTYDQSNWIGLRIPDGSSVTQSILNRPLKGVVGKLTSTVNPEFILEQMPEANGEAVNYNPNVYIAASFNSSNPQTSSVTGKQYFFVQPKPMEIANVEWAQWNGEKFIAPIHDESHQSWNQAELTGEFDFNGSYLEQGGVFLETGHCYEMLPALIKINDGSNHPHVYILGNVNDIGWNPNKGVEMSTSDGNIYTATVTVNNVDNGYGFFSFTKKLDPKWDNIKDYRFGAVANGANFLVQPQYIGQELSLAYWSSDSRSFQLTAGTYRLTVNLSTLKLVISPAQSNAPGLKGETNNSYVVYPLQISKVTTEENGVITAIDNFQSDKTVSSVVYYNMMGVASDKPHSGINIVETRYSDGTRNTTKVIR